MKTTHTVTIAVLPIGELDSELVKSQVESKISTLKRLGAHLIVADPISDQAGAERSIPALADSGPDLLVIIALRGLSAQAQEVGARLSPVPCLLWPVEGGYALPSSLLAAGALREAGMAVELLYGSVDHPVSLARLRCVVRAATAFSRIRRSRIGIIGGLFPNLVSCRYDPQAVTARLGATLLPISFQALRDSLRPLTRDGPQVAAVRQEITDTYTVNGADMTALEAGITLHLALKHIAQEQKIDGFAVECWAGLPRELGLNPCLGFIEDAYALGCEGDVMLCISVLLVQYVTGARAYAGDLYDLDLDGRLTLIHCGAPASLASNKSEVVLAKSELARQRGFETITCRPRLASGPVTLFRFYGRNCDRLHMAAAQLLSSEQSPNLTVKAQLNGSRWDFLDQCFGNHYLVVPGDIRPELALLAKWLGIAVFET